MIAPNDRKVIKFQTSEVRYLYVISCTLKNTEIKTFADDVTVYKTIRGSSA